MPGTLSPRHLLVLSLAVLGAACVKRPIDYQREYARSLRPAELQAWPVDGAAPPTTIKVVKVRAWVDEDFQAQTPRWSARISDQLRRANRVLEPQFGRRFELVEVAAWPRQSRPPDLQAALVELLQQDPGRDVDLVLGYVSALRVPEASTERLGMATLGGRHLVLRAMVLEAEYDAMGRALDLLTVEEREALARERRVHREVSILLHEWAHTVGATHESLSASVMADVYHQQAVGFSPESVRLVEAGLRAQESGQAPPAPPATPPPAAPASPPAPPPRDPAASPTPPRHAGRPTLATLQAREFALKSGAGAAGGWLQLALDADKLGAPASAERAALRAEGRIAAVLLQDVRRARREVALPLEGVAPPQEPEYVKRVGKVLALAADGKAAEARAARQALAAAFPGSPGLALAECALAEVERAGGTSACERAVKTFEEAPTAHLHLGAQHGRAGRWPEARDHYRRALELDDAVSEPWSRLALALVKVEQQQQLRELQARYQARFGFPLRPARE